MTNETPLFEEKQHTDIARKWIYGFKQSYEYLTVLWQRKAKLNLVYFEGQKQTW